MKNRNFNKEIDPDYASVMRAYFKAQGVIPQEIGMDKEEAAKYGLGLNGQLVPVSTADNAMENDDEYDESTEYDESPESPESLGGLTPDELLLDGETAVDLEDDMAELSQAGAEISDSAELSQSYKALRDLGVSPILAYAITSQDRENLSMEFMTPPPTIGRVNAKTLAEKSYYSPQEVDKLTEKDLKNPKLLQNVLDSMTKWKN